MSCSKLSNAMSLSSRVSSGSGERIAAMEEIIRSASDGPPKSALRASGFRCRFVGGPVEGSLAVVEEFSTLHFRSSFMPGSMVCKVRLVVVVR